MDLHVDKDRALREELRELTGIFVLALGADGRWGSYDIAVLDRESLKAWLRSKCGKNPMAEDVIGLVMGYGRLSEVPEPDYPPLPPIECPNCGNGDIDNLTLRVPNYQIRSIDISSDVYTAELMDYNYEDIGEKEHVFCEACKFSFDVPEGVEMEWV